MNEFQEMFAVGWIKIKAGTKPGRWSDMKSNIVTMSIDLLQEGNLNRKIYTQ